MLWWATLPRLPCAFGLQGQRRGGVLQEKRRVCVCTCVSVCVCCVLCAMLAFSLYTFSPRKSGLAACFHELPIPARKTPTRVIVHIHVHIQRWR